MRREEALSELAYRTLAGIPHLRILGAPEGAEDSAVREGAGAERHGIFSFTLDGVHPHDIAEILSADGIAVRAGHHCAQVLLQHLGVSSAARVSLAFYNTEEEILRLGESLRSVRRRMGYAE